VLIPIGRDHNVKENDSEDPRGGNLRWLERIRTKKGVVSIEALADGLAVVARGCHSDDAKVDVLTVLDKTATGGAYTRALSDLVEKHKIGRRSCNVILPQADYQLLLVEAPDVPEENLRDTMRWRIKDLVSIPLESAVVDVFLLPQGSTRSTKKMVYVVVSERKCIQNWVNLVAESGLMLNAIDIAEMAMRNIVLLCQQRERQAGESAEGQEERAIAVARVVAGGGSLALYRGGNLFLARQFKVNYLGGLLDDLPIDPLALEIQRSLDYYERQMGMVPPKVLYFCGENLTEDKITVELKRAMTVPVKHLDMMSALGLEEHDEEHLLHTCVGALGGVFRSLAA